jgi:hypothetical protein
MNKVDEIIQSFKDCGLDKDTSLRLALITVHRIIRVYEDEICGRLNKWSGSKYYPI